MTEGGYIRDVPLPLNQDFNALKSRALEYIQAHSNYQWTNLNASDPGVTILEQICYALTELGYCNDFTIQDILAHRDGKIQIYDQFYLPESILTTSPVTTDDYRKYVIDSVANAGNAVFLRNNTIAGCRVYRTLLLITEAVQTTAVVQTKVEHADYVCKAAFVALNKARNLGELFVLPTPLTPVIFELTGNVVIESAEELTTILDRIKDSISKYIFSPVVPQSYKQLLIRTETTDTIFDGPRLKTGWISTDMLSEKKNKVTIYEVIELIQAIPGVVSVVTLQFAGTSLDYVSCEPDELIVISTDLFYSNNQLTFTASNAVIDSEKYTITGVARPDTPGFESNILFGAGIDIRADIPKAKFRDINTYYSIQNTFPDLYPVGPEFIDSNATDFQIAQSRQLMGYLTLFDQVLANQFSQLANVEQLFSFSNAMTGTPSDKHHYYAVDHRYQYNKGSYPVPYLRFSPSYYFQSLYDVPGIRPLLKGNEVFDFHLQPQSRDAAEKIEWERFKLDPYNTYIRELTNIMEEENGSLKRRNAILNHLLARHGESSMLIDAYIAGSVYTRDELKDKVIFKSLYLQNLGLLSYNRYKAYNYLQADPFVQKSRKKRKLERKQGQSRRTQELRSEFKSRFLSQEITLNEEKLLRETISDRGLYHSLKFIKWILEGNTIDSVFDSERISDLERIAEDEFRNYSGIELKLSLLFGLKTLYRDFLLSESDETGQQIQAFSEPVNDNLLKLQALSLISQRKGFLLIELNLLLHCLCFDIYFLDSQNRQWVTETPQGYEAAFDILNILRGKQGASQELYFPATQADKAEVADQSVSFTVGEHSIRLKSVTTELSDEYEVISGKKEMFAIRANGTEWNFDWLNSTLCGVMFIFPDYIPTFKTYSFYSRLEMFLRNELPVDAVIDLRVASFNVLRKLIPAFRKWHDSLIYDSLDRYKLFNSAGAAVRLIEQLYKTKTLPYAQA